MAGPALLSKAAGPLVAAAILGHEAGPGLLLPVLLAVSIASLVFYRRALTAGAQPHCASAFDKTAV